MLLAGLLSVVITGPCGWVEFVDFLQDVFFSAGNQALLSFKPFFFVEALLVFVDFNGFPVQSNIMIVGVVQYFSILK